MEPFEQGETPVRLFSNPPIVEAVINLRPSAGLPEDKLAKISRLVRKTSTRSEKIYSAHINIKNDTREVETRTEHIGEKWFFEDASDIVVTEKSGLTVSRLAPYQGWERLLEKFNDFWPAWRKHCNAQTYRVGARFINRIDVPFDGPKITIEDYFTAHIHHPDREIVFANHNLDYVTFGVPEGLMVRVKIGSMPPVLIEHASFLLDIDVWYDDVQINDSTLGDLLATLRVEKNRAFESCLTDKAKELFG